MKLKTVIYILLMNSYSIISLINCRYFVTIIRLTTNRTLTAYHPDLTVLITKISSKSILIMSHSNKNPETSQIS